MEKTISNNHKLTMFKNEIKGKRIAVLGLGISNLPLVKYLYSINSDITVFDLADESKLKANLYNLKDLNISYSLGNRYLDKLKGFDIIFKTPKIRPDIPQLLSEIERGADVTSEMEVFVNLCPAKIFGITGSMGKTTTATIIFNFLKESGYNCYLGGNIGTPLMDRIDNIRNEDMVVLELSSFQLQTMLKKGADISVLTNLSPNHLDVHKSMDEYIESKANIFLNQSPHDLAVFNLDCYLSMVLSEKARGRVRYFSRKQEVSDGVYSDEEFIYFCKNGLNKPVMRVNEIFLPGLHNLENYLAAIAAVYDYADNSSIIRSAREFKGVEHRMEFVREFNTVSFYNDSKATGPSSTIAALEAFPRKVILIAGGRDKNNDYREIGQKLLEHCKTLVLAGETSGVIRDSMLEAAKAANRLPVKYEIFDNLVNAVEFAYKNAGRNDIICFSPASTSFDMFSNFEERGKKFKEIVNSL